MTRPKVNKKPTKHKKADKQTFSAETNCRVYGWGRNGFGEFMLSTVPVTLISPTKCKLKTFWNHNFAAVAKTVCVTATNSYTQSDMCPVRKKAERSESFIDNQCLG